MKHVIALRGMATALLLAQSLVGCGGQTGGEVTPPIDPRFPPDSSIPVPQNVVATTSFKRLEVEWDAVPGATGYSVYVATAPGQPILQMSRFDLSAPPFVDTAAPNWVTKYFRVAARVGDRQSRLSADVSAAMPTAGWIVAEHDAGGTTSIRLYHSDEPDVVIDEIAGAKFDRIVDLFGAQIVRVGSLGVVWGIPAGNPTEFTKLGVFVSSRPATLAAEPNHTYKYFGLIASDPPRIVFRDYDVGANTFAVRSAAPDGSDPRLLKTGCSAIQGPADPMPPIFAASGVVFQCSAAGAVHWWYSDGAAPAAMLPSVETSDPRQAKLLFADRVIFWYPFPAAFLVTQRFDGSFQQDFIEPARPVGKIRHEILYNDLTGEPAVGPNGVIAVRRFDTTTTPAQYCIVRVHYTNEPANPNIRTFAPCPSDSIYSAPTFLAYSNMSPDGSRFTMVAAIASGVYRARIFGLTTSPDDNPVQIDVGTDNGTAAWFLPNGKIAVNRCSQPTCQGANDGQYLYDSSGANPSGKVAEGTFYFRGAAGDYAVLIDPSVRHELTAVNTATNIKITRSSTDLRPTFRANGHLTFVDGNGGAFFARFPGLPTPARIDLVPTTAVTQVGEGVGNRVFFVMRRAAGNDDVVSFDLQTLSATTIVRNATGFFFAD